MADSGKLHVAILVILGCIIYANTINVPFYLDDIPNITDNKAIHIDSLSLKSLFDALKNSPNNNRVLPNLSFALTYYFFGLEVEAYHVINIAIHILTTLILYQFIKTTLLLPSSGKFLSHASWAAFFSALLWMVHPVQTQAVTYIVQRMTSMSTLFFMLSMLMYVQARMNQDRRKRFFFFAICFISGMFSIASKEIGITLPVFIFLYEWYFLQNLKTEWLKENKRYFIFFGIIILFLSFILLGGEPYRRIIQGYEHRDFTMAERLLTQFRVIIFYISLILYPLPGRLSLEHGFGISTSVIDPITTLLSIISILLLIFLAIVTRKNHRMFSFVILWFLGNLLLESSILPLEIVFEHRLYLPSTLVFIILPLLCLKFINKKIVSSGILLFFALALSVFTYQRNNVWANQFLFYKQNLQNAPGSARANNNFARYYLRLGEYRKAMPYLQKALELEPGRLGAHRDLGDVYFRLGSYDEAIRHYKQYLQEKPGDPFVHFNMGEIYRILGQKKAAILYFHEVLNISPEHAEAHNKLGILYSADGKYEIAARHFRKVVTLTDFKEFSALVNLANCYLNLDSYEQALFYFYKALQLKPDDEYVLKAINFLKTKT